MILHDDPLHSWIAVKILCSFLSGASDDVTCTEFASLEDKIVFITEWLLD